MGSSTDGAIVAEASPQPDLICPCLPRALLTPCSCRDFCWRELPGRRELSEDSAQSSSPSPLAGVSRRVDFGLGGFLRKLGTVSVQDNHWCPADANPGHRSTSTLLRKSSSPKSPITHPAPCTPCTPASAHQIRPCASPGPRRRPAVGRAAPDPHRRPSPRFQRRPASAQRAGQTAELATCSE